MYYLKAVHIIFVVTWFAGIFYMPRLFIYNTEAAEKPAEIKAALREQFNIMMKRLWYGITWPSAVLTLFFGLWTMVNEGWHKLLFQPAGHWLLVKLGFVVLLYIYFFSLHKIFKQQLNGIFKYSSQSLRMYNEVATVFLVAIVMLATVKDSLSFVWGLIVLAGFIVILISAIKVYKIIRNKN